MGMKLIINNQPLETTAATLQALATERQLPMTGVAIAVNNKMVKRTDWPTFALKDGQQITILKAFSGG